MPGRTNVLFSPILLCRQAQERGPIGADACAGEVRR